MEKEEKLMEAEEENNPMLDFIEEDKKKQTVQSTRP